MNVLFWSVIATTIVSLISLIGVFFLAVKSEILNKMVFLLVGFSAGALMGDAFIHLIPEGIVADEKYFPLFILAGFCLFFVMERVVHWRHCHEKGGECQTHPFTYLSLIGDALHNFIDGLVIVASFAVDFRLGLATTLAVVLHEIPQEIGDFSILIFGGFTKKKALFFNFISALFAVAGAIIGFLLVKEVSGAINPLLAITAGGFIYIAASDLIPELHKESKNKIVAISFLFFILGLALMYFLKMFLG
ncbi:MAG: ZIP family metal transporter [Patescibacteria group bacterium]|jgi:zinc and cadmium transporter